MSLQEYRFRFGYYPQVIYYSGKLLHRLEEDAIEIRPMTVTGLIKGIGRNFVVMRYWRFIVLLRILGLLNTPEQERLSWRHFTLRFWEHWMPGRLWPARLYRYIRRRFA